VEVTWEGYETGEGEEKQYPVISVVWDDYETGYPDDYIQKCIEAFERFEVPKEIYERNQERRELLNDLRETVDRITEHLLEGNAPKTRSKP